jgi:hypothetical protein
MTALELLTVICAVLALAAAATLSLLAARTLRAARDLEAATRTFTDEALPAVEELRLAARRASGEVERIDDLLDVAAAVGDRVDSATEATYRVLTSPVIKGVALATGTRRAASRLRGRPAPTARRSPSRSSSTAVPARRGTARSAGGRSLGRATGRPSRRTGAHRNDVADSAVSLPDDGTIR